ncbi:MAG: hypothetical protein H6Q77_2187 [Gemmatimonadetes bacterium]|jgi:hypothetical protein|nr:hypothetical protein [Gemmatimonadota bacterium]
MTKRGDGKGSGSGLLLLLGVVLLAFVAQYVSTKPTAPPAATQAITRWVAQDRRQSAISSQESKEGYVIDPALAKRMLADTAIRVRVTGVRGFSDNVVARARVTAPGADGAELTTVRYFALTRGTADDWTVSGEAKPRDWYLKLW